MTTTLLSIISDQTIPNLLVIKELQGQFDNQLFITTDYVEKKGLDCWIENACGMEKNSVKRMKVVEDNLSNIREKLSTLDKQNTRYIVNLSGGTKVMTIGVYEFFAVAGNRIIYVPIGKNVCKELFPSSAEEVIKYSLNLTEYLTAYGLYYEPSCNILKLEDFTRRFFKSLKSKKFNVKNEELIQNAHLFEDNDDKVYFSGAWFEEYIFHKVVEDFQLQPDCIALNVELRRNKHSVSNDNEYDVVFVYNNELFVIEAKVTAGNTNFIKDNLDKYMYKLAAITRDFGLRIHSAIFTLSYTESLLKNKAEGIKNRQKILGIKAIADAKFFLMSESMKTIFKIKD